MAKTKMTERKVKVVQTKDKPFACETCGTRFLRRTYLNVHMKKFHESKEETNKVHESKETKTSHESKKETIKDITGSPSLSPGPSTSKQDDGFLLEDWSSPDIQLLEEEEASEQEQSGSESVDNCCNEKDKEKQGENELDVSLKGEPNDGEERSGDNDCDEKNGEKQGEVNMKEGEPRDGEEKREEKDTRTIRNIYEGRVYSKHTQPMKPFAPKRKISTNEQPDQKRAKEENVESGTEDIDEIQISVNQNMRKRVVLKFPGGKRLQMDLSFN